MMSTPTDVSYAVYTEVIDDSACDVRYDLARRDAAEPGASKVYYLPKWPNSERALPHSLARSALFGVVARGKRRTLQNERLVSRKDATICFSGEQLDQGDVDVWMQLVHYASAGGIAFGDRIIFDRASLLAAIGRSVGGSDYQWLSETITRLSAATVEIRTERFIASFGLLEQFDCDTKTGDHYVKLNPRCRVLFQHNQFAYIDWQARREIADHRDLTKWLQIYASSHKAGSGHRISLEKLKCWSGCGNARLRDFRASLLKSLAELTRVLVIQGATISRSGVVTWHRLDHVMRKRLRKAASDHPGLDGLMHFPAVKVMVMCADEIKGNVQRHERTG